MVAFLIGVALVMGLFMAIQPAINLELRRFVGSPAQAAMVSTIVSTISLAFFVFVIQRKPWPSLARRAFHTVVDLGRRAARRGLCRNQRGVDIAPGRGIRVFVGRARPNGHRAVAGPLRLVRGADP